MDMYEEENREYRMISSAKEYKTILKQAYGSDRIMIHLLLGKTEKSGKALY